MPFQSAPTICPLCQKTASFNFVQDFKNQSAAFSLYQCSVCGGQFWAPFKNPGAQWYESGDDYNVKDENHPRPIHCYHKYFLAGNQDLKNKTILDIGCGTGEFLSVLEARGALAYGTDIDPGAVAFAKKLYQPKHIFALAVNDYFQQDQAAPYDIITAFEVFEHVDDPWTILTFAQKSLQPGGRLVMSTPSRRRFLANLAYWDYPYHHLSRWDEAAIRKIASLAGFQSVKITYLNQFNQLKEVFLEFLAKKLQFKKASGLKNISQSPAASGFSLKQLIIKIVYRTGRFIGIIIIPYFLAALAYPISRIFYPKSGLMYIEAFK